MYAIDKNIPMPDKIPRGGAESTLPKYPFAEMEIGDSFLVPTDGTTSENQLARNRIGGSFRSGKMARFINIETRNVNGGVRCWRVS